MWARPSRWAGRSRSTWRAGPRPSRAARTRPSSPPSSGPWPRRTRGLERRREHCGRAPLRPLRGPLRAGDADPRARRARARVDGGEVWLKREDLTHTGSHKINNAIGQGLLAARMGKPRVIAETGAGQHGVAAATACALLGLECIVYMGTEDMRRQRPDVERMRLLGAEVRGVEAGARTLKEAVSAAIRDWVTYVETTHYIIGSCVGPAPYPSLVRDLQPRIREQAPAPPLEAAGA